MSLRLLDHVYISRKRAIELGFTHQGRLFGVPVWVEFDPRTEDIRSSVTKFGLAELLVDIGTIMLQASNANRAPGDESMFPFLIDETPLVSAREVS